MKLYFINDNFTLVIAFFGCKQPASSCKVSLTAHCLFFVRVCLASLGISYRFVYAIRILSLCFADKIGSTCYQFLKFLSRSAIIN